jgi:hypothetical protein
MTPTSTTEPDTETEEYSDAESTASGPVTTFVFDGTEYPYEVPGADEQHAAAIEFGCALEFIINLLDAHATVDGAAAASSDDAVYTIPLPEDADVTEAEVREAFRSLETTVQIGRHVLNSDAYEAFAAEGTDALPLALEQAVAGVGMVAQNFAVDELEMPTDPEADRFDDVGGIDVAAHLPDATAWRWS